jgi:hypothetical protein
MRAHTSSRPPAQAGGQPTAFQTAFLTALRRRVDRNPSGYITLPVGNADIAEIAHVLTALDRADDGGDR